MIFPFNFTNKCLSCLPAEMAHNLTLKALSLGISPKITPKNWSMLKTDCAGLKCATPIALAAGLDKNAQAISAFLNMGFSAIECGAVTPIAQKGQKKPRLFRLKKDLALINRMGFNNDGLAIIAKRLETYRNKIFHHHPNRLNPEHIFWRSKKNLPPLTNSPDSFKTSLKKINSVSYSGLVGINIGTNKDSKNRIGDYLQILKGFWFLADYFSINISSPNTPGLRELQSSDYLSELLEQIMETRKELLNMAQQTHISDIKQQKENYITNHHKHTLSDIQPLSDPQNKKYNQKNHPLDLLENTYEFVNLDQYNPPIFLKLSPDIDDFSIEPIAELAYTYGINGLIISNTTIERPSYLQSQNTFQKGGLSGAPLFGKSTRLLRAFYTITNGKMALIGSGGVDSGVAAYAKIRSGASMVQLYTALIYQGPKLIPAILDDLCLRLKADGFKSISEAIGKF